MKVETLKMKITIATLILFFMNNLPAHAGCSKSEICAMLGKMNHFSILDKCPSSAPLLAECKKVKETTLEDLPPGEFIDNGNGTVTDTANKLVWMKNHFEDAFIHTTNTDGYHLRSGCSTNKVLEVHGSMWRLQCLDVCSHAFWTEETVPLCKLDRQTMRASNYPICPQCHGTARPHILMFGDMEYVGHPEQEKNFENFLRKEVDLALLVGSSGAVPTNDYLALELKKRGVKLININPDQSANNIAQAEVFIPLKSGDAFSQLGALVC